MDILQLKGDQLFPIVIWNVLRDARLTDVLSYASYVLRRASQDPLLKCGTIRAMEYHPYWTFPQGNSIRTFHRSQLTTTCIYLNAIYDRRSKAPCLEIVHYKAARVSIWEPATDNRGVRERFTKVIVLFAKNGRLQIKEFRSTAIIYKIMCTYIYMT